MSISTTQSSANYETKIATITDKERKNKYTTLKNIGSIALGYGGYKAVNHYGHKILNKYAEGFSRESLFSSYIINGKTAKSIFNASGLASKGVRLKNLDYTRLKSHAAKKYFRNFGEYVKNFKFGTLKESYINLGLENAKNMTAQGLNSFYDQYNKTIINNFKNLGMAVPHEMGHAANFNSKNPLLKILTKSRSLQVLVPIIFATALLRKPKKEGEESNTIVGKGLDFVKDNAVALTAACWAPTVIEEGIASIRGAKMAKSFLSPEKLKAINIFNMKAWSTYAISAGIAIAGVFIANKIRNATAPKSEMERDVKYKQAENLDKVA